MSLEYSDILKEKFWFKALRFVLTLLLIYNINIYIVIIHLTFQGQFFLSRNGH